MAGLTLRLDQRRRARARRSLGDNLLAYAFLLGGLICFELFSCYPLFRSIVLSFTQVNFVTDPIWVGWDNYRALFADPLYWTAWRNTFLFTGLALIFGYALPFAAAVLLGELRHVMGFFRL